MESTPFEFQADDGQTLFVHHWRPGDAARAASPRGIVHISHGMAEHAGRYAHVARALTEAGFVVYGNDHRGHGRTATRDEDVGFFAPERGWERVLRDLRQLFAHERSRHAGAPLVLLGHSMGSFLAQQLMYEDGGMFRAVALSASSGKPEPLAAAGRLVARAEKLRLGARGRSKLLTALSFDAWNKAFAPNRTRFDWLSRDAAEVDKYAADPRCGFACTTQLWIDLLDALPELARRENQARVPKDLPVYVFAGGEDPVSNRTRGLAQLLDAYKHAGMRDVTHRFYAGARHETLNEVNRDEVIRDVLAWVGAKVP